MTRRSTTLSALLVTLGCMLPAAAGTDTCITDEQRRAIHLQLAENRRALGRSTTEALATAAPPPSSAGTVFGWPLQAQHQYAGDFAVHAICYYVDHGSGTTLKDYECGSWTYDGHRGTDIAIWPYPWAKMDGDDVLVVAAAAGTILGKDDGQYDRNCAGCTSCDWNAVYVGHADGSVAWYGHLKSGSLTSKSVGGSVEQGEVLGTVGASGNVSGGPHLHFEVYDSSGNLIDPFHSAGGCNVLNDESWWAEQRSYLDKGINALYLQDQSPNIANCPDTTDSVDRRAMVEAGVGYYFTAYLRQVESGDTVLFSITDATGSIVDEWTGSVGNDGPHCEYALSSRRTLSSTLTPGKYWFQATYDGATYSRPFCVDSSPTNFWSRELWGCLTDFELPKDRPHAR